MACPRQGRPDSKFLWKNNGFLLLPFRLIFEFDGILFKVNGGSINKKEAV